MSSALPEGAEFVLFFLITWAAYFAYEEVVRPWWKRGFRR